MLVNPSPTTHHPSPIVRLTVRWRLTLWYVGMLSLALLIFGGIVYAWQAARIEAQLRDDVALLQRQAGAFATGPPGRSERGAVTVGGVAGPAMTTVSKGDDGGPSTIRVVDSAGAAGAVAAIAPPRGIGISTEVAPASGSTDIVLVVGPQGQIVQSSGPVGAGDVQRILAQAGPSAVGDNGRAFPLIGVGGSAQASADYQFYAQHIVVGDGGPATLIMGRPSAAVGELQRLMVTLFVAGVITLVVVGAGGYWLAGRAMRPVRAITRAAREIGETDLSRRLNLPNRDELGELAATFDNMLVRLDEAFRRQRQFTNDASHELRTPLTIVELEVERALARPVTSPEQAQALAAIRDESAYMARLVNDLLTLARADAGQAPFTAEPVDLGELVLEVVERHALMARRRQIGVAVGDLPERPLLGDRVLLKQMLANLVDNAIKYTAGHGRRVCVEGGTSGNGNDARLWVRVSDDGPGIPPEHLPHLFDRFYRADRSRNGRDGDNDADRPGSGLGLSIVHWVADVHGGDVQAESVVGQGSTFTVWLPLAVASTPGR
jgi:signal transduction histidine kinase